MKKSIILVGLIALQCLMTTSVDARAISYNDDLATYRLAQNGFLKQCLDTMVQEALQAKARYESDVANHTITLSFAGDVTLGTYYGQASWNRLDEVAAVNPTSYFFENVVAIFEKDDLTVVNLEGPLTTDGVRVDKAFAIKGDPSYAEALVAGSIEAVGLANNHTYDYGQEGYNQTLKHVKAVGVAPFGYQTIGYHTLKGMRVALIGEKAWDASPSTVDRLVKQVQTATQEADLVIVMMHWGVERHFYPETYQRLIAHRLIDEGADLIVGSHPHVIQGIETYKDKQIVYSMGNFCFGANKNPSDKDSFIYQQTFRLTEEGIISPDSQVIPCSISSTHTHNNYQPTPLEGDESERVLERLHTYSEVFEISYFKDKRP